MSSIISVNRILQGLFVLGLLSWLIYVFFLDFIVFCTCQFNFSLPLLFLWNSVNATLEGKLLPLIGYLIAVYHPATFSPMLDSRVLPMQRPVSGPCVGWATLPQLSYLCQNFTPHPYILQPITCGVNPETPTCWAVLPHLSIFHLFYFPHCVWGEGP